MPRKLPKPPSSPEEAERLARKLARARAVQEALARLKVRRD